VIYRIGRTKFRRWDEARGKSQSRRTFVLRMREIPCKATVGIVGHFTGPQSHSRVAFPKTMLVYWNAEDSITWPDSCRVPRYGMRSNGCPVTRHCSPPAAGVTQEPSNRYKEGSCEVYRGLRVCEPAGCLHHRKENCPSRCATCQIGIVKIVSAEILSKVVNQKWFLPSASSVTCFR
jgi:hypothetical protein